MRFLAPFLLTGGLTLAGCAEPAPTDLQSGLADAGADRAATAAAHRYRITLENLTTGQVFSPGVAATHTKKASVWASGAAASEGIRLIAEDGLEATAVAELTGAPGIFDVVDIASHQPGRWGCPAAQPANI
jgi:hypothetical protein